MSKIKNLYLKYSNNKQEHVNYLINKLRYKIQFLKYFKGLDNYRNTLCRSSPYKIIF